MEKQIQAQPGQYLTFILKGQACGIPINTVREINRVSEITPIPQAPSFVAGVVNLRGKVIPVANLRLRLGMETAAYTKETCIIVIDGTAGQIGMIVDSVSGVIELDTSQLEPPPSMGAASDQHYLMGVGKLENQVVMLLDIIRCLSTEELYQASAAKAQAA